MSSDTIQVNYDQVEGVAWRFDQQAQACEAVLHTVQQRLESLANGGWEGKGAQSFFDEMNDGILPSLNRLAKALHEGSQTTGQTAQHFQSAEEAAKNLISGVLNGQASGFASMGTVGFSSPGGGTTQQLGVSPKQVNDYDWAFRGKTDERFKKDIEWAAKQVGVNPGLLAANLIAETRRGNYFSKGKVNSFLVGVDDFYDKRHDIRKKVPAYAKIGWNNAQKPTTNDNETGRTVRTINFNSGRDALLASAVYLKHGEVVLRQEAVKLGHDFDKLPVKTRFALSRLAFNAGHRRAKKNLRQVLNGQDVLIRKPGAKAGPQRKATIRTAQAMHLSDKVFGVSPN